MLKYVLLVSLVTFTFAFKKNKSTMNYSCTARTGASDGYGRLSKEGEYSSYFKIHAKQGEFVIFQYRVNGKKYWFPFNKCKIISSKHS